MTLATLWIAGPVAPSSGSDFMMKGPREEVSILDVKVDLETSNVRLALLGLIGMYQQFVSPIGGVDRCGFLAVPTTDIKPFGITALSWGS